MGGVFVRVARARMRTFGQRYGPPRVERAAREHDRGERAVRAAVHDDLDVLGDEPAIAGDAGPMADDRRVALGRGRDVLVAVVDHPDGLLRLAREERGVQPDDRGELLLAAEPAAGLGLDHAGGSVVEAEAALERRVQVVRALERARDGDAAALGRHGDHRVVLDVELLLVADAILALEDDVGGGERRLDVVAGLDRVLGEDVVGLERIEDPGSFVVRGSARCRASRSVALSGRGEQRQRLGVVLDLAADRDEDRLVGLDRADDVLAGDVGRGDDDDLGPVEARIEVEGIEGGVRIGRADRGAVPRPGDDDVVRVQGRAGELGRSLAAQRRGRTRATGDDGGRAQDDGARGLGARGQRRWSARPWDPPWRTTIPPRRSAAPDRGQTAPDRSAPPRAVPCRTVIVSRTGYPMVPSWASRPIIGCLIAPIWHSSGNSPVMEVTQEILLPVLLAAIVVNTVILVLVVARRRAPERDRPSTRSALEGSFMSTSYVDRSGTHVLAVERRSDGRACRA